VPQDFQKIATAAPKHVDIAGMSVGPVASQTFTPDGGAIIRAGPSAHDAAWPG
jgi:hypothetical protein